MAQLNNFKLTLLFLGAIFSGSIFAQNKNTSENKERTIVMTKAELNSFLSTVADARRTKLKEQKRKRDKEELARLRAEYDREQGYDNRYRYAPSREPRYRSSYDAYRNNNVSNQEIIRELNRLNQRMDRISDNRYNGFPAMRSGGGGDRSTIIMPGGNSSPAYAQPPRNSTRLVPNDDGGIEEERINQLQSELDSLKNKETDSGKDSFADSLDVNRSKLDKLKRQMDSLRSEVEKAQAEQPETKRMDFKKEVLFANNSDQVKAAYFSIIQDLTQILVEYPEAKILLEGWASPTGSSSYNKQLSMRRAESVERAFVNNGIDASRILTAFKGEDTTSSEQHARRVDMAVIVR